ncbi:endoplasmic reticulum vesicle transporter-domain-containing protein [Lactifluus subvellereus]|nr:endoplasmic reticulum vesicle transporter-domain-containing protein [Lactifluus subvellereus]
MYVVKAVETYIVKMVSVRSVTFSNKGLTYFSIPIPIPCLYAVNPSLTLVYLTDHIDNDTRERMAYMNEGSVGALEAELKDPKYGEYYLCHDYAPLLSCLPVFPINYTPSPTTPLYGPSPSTWDAKALDRHVQGLIVAMLSLKKPLIHMRRRAMAKKLAVELHPQVKMPAKTFFGGLKTMDAFGKTMEDVKVRTRTGAFHDVVDFVLAMALVSVAIILSFTLMEFVDYRRLDIGTSVVVDRRRGERLTVHLNVTFPRVSCYYITRELQRDITHSVVKARLTAAVERAACVRLLWFMLRREPPDGGCCNLCDAVRDAYVRRGWSFGNPNAIDQVQSSEGCNVAGSIRVNKVIGNIHITPGHPFRAAQSQIYDFVLYLKNDGNRHDFSHTLHHKYFTADDEADVSKAQVSKEMRERLGIDQNPLDEHMARALIFVPLDSDGPDTRTEHVRSLGGLLTVGSIIDSALFATQRSFKKSAATKGQADVNFCGYIL